MSNSNMTPQQAAEVLRQHLQWRKQKEHESDIAYVGPDALTAALETAIECMSAPTPTDDEISNAAIEYSGFCEAREHDPECSCATFEEGAKWAIARFCLEQPSTPPTDEQIGDVFEKHADMKGLVTGRPYSMTRTAAIPFVREVIRLYFGNK